MPYLRTLYFGFVYDDHFQILALTAGHSWRTVAGYFFKPVPGVAVRYYRPILFLWFRLNYSLWGTHAWGWHLTNVALHATVSLLILLLLRKYFTDVRCAVAGALVFATHPAHIETVAWISGCSDSLMVIGLLGSLLLWMKNCEAPALARRAGSLLSGGLALLTKETAIILPVLIALQALGGIPTAGPEAGPISKRLRIAFWQTAPYAGMTAVYLGVRSWVLKGIPGAPTWLSHAHSLLTMPSLLLFYLRHLIWPTKLSVFYDFPIVRSAGSTLFWLPLGVLAAIAAAAWLWFQRSQDARIFFAGLWILAPLAPVSYIGIFQPDDFVHDRYLYLPVLGFSVLTAILSGFLWKWETGRRASFLPMTILGVLVACLGLATAVQAEPWKTDSSLYTHAVQVAPQNIEARNNVAIAYADQGRYQEASAVWKALLEDRPGLWQANYNYGYVNYRMGNLAVAEYYLRRAISIDGNEASQYLYLGTTYFKEGRVAEAAGQVRQAIARNPSGGGYHFTLGMIELQQGNVAAARKEMQEELKYHPETAERVGQAQAMIDRLTESAP